MEIRKWKFGNKLDLCVTTETCHKSSMLGSQNCPFSNAMDGDYSLISNKRYQLQTLSTTALYWERVCSHYRYNYIIRDIYKYTLVYRSHNHCITESDPNENLNTDIHNYKFYNIFNANA